MIPCRHERNLRSGYFCEKSACPPLNCPLRLPSQKCCPASHQQSCDKPCRRAEQRYWNYVTWFVATYLLSCHCQWSIIFLHIKNKLKLDAKNITNKICCYNCHLLSFDESKAKSIAKTRWDIFVFLCLKGVEENVASNRTQWQVAIHFSSWHDLFKELDMIKPAIVTYSVNKDDTCEI